MQKGENAANFSISTMMEKEVSMYGRTRKMNTLEALVKTVASQRQMNENREWHKVRISCRGNVANVYYDGKKILSYSKLDKTGKNDITFWVTTPKHFTKT